MKTTIEKSVNPHHKEFSKIMIELNEIIHLATSCNTLDSVLKYFRTSRIMINSGFFIYGSGSSHIWVAFNDKKKDRILLITE
jgi:hypothetical protein